MVAGGSGLVNDRTDGRKMKSPVRMEAGSHNLESSCPFLTAQHKIGSRALAVTSTPFKKTNEEMPSSTYLVSPTLATSKETEIFIFNPDRRTALP